MLTMNTTMARIWILCNCFLVALLPQSSVQSTPAPRLGTVERYLYAQLEDALDGATLEQLREVFFQQPRSTKIPFSISITADSISHHYCDVSPDNVSYGRLCNVSQENAADSISDRYYNVSQPCAYSCEPAFCRNYGNTSTAYDNWKLCCHLRVMWKSEVCVELLEILANTVVPWCAHGPSYMIANELIHLPASAYNWWSIPGEDYVFDVREPTNIHISLKDLDCKPYMFQLTNAVGEFFTWIEVYTEAGGKPQSWDPQQQATVSMDGLDIVWGPFWLPDNDVKNTLKFLQTFGLCGCFFFTLLLSLLIPRLFLRYHNKLVTNKIKSPGSRSLYWGTAVVSLFLTLVILLGKLFLSLSFVCLPHFYSQLYFKNFLASIVVQIFIPIVFLIISILASRNSKAVPMPAAMFTTHVLFCCRYCFCCFAQRKSNGVQILTLWAFLTFIYYNIMEAVSYVFALCISTPLTISCALMYFSGVFFAIMLVSIILFSCQSTGRSYSRPAKCVGVVDVCITLFSLSFIILVLVAFFRVSPLFKVKGFEFMSLKFSLVHSLMLTVVGWFIRKKLLTGDSHSAQLTNHGTTGNTLNDGEMEGEEEQSPEENQHLLA